MLAAAESSLHARVVTGRISSSGTALIKYGVFPLVIAAAIAASVVEVIYTGGVYGYVTLVAVALLVAWMGPWVYRCKDVFATETGLCVGYRDATEIPYREITTL